MTPDPKIFLSPVRNIFQFPTGEVAELLQSAVQQPVFLRNGHAEAANENGDANDGGNDVNGGGEEEEEAVFGVLVPLTEIVADEDVAMPPFKAAASDAVVAALLRKAGGEGGGDGVVGARRGAELGGERGRGERLRRADRGHTRQWQLVRHLALRPDARLAAPAAVRRLRRGRRARRVAPPQASLGPRRGGLRRGAAPEKDAHAREAITLMV